ncbi:MAG TPA: hypothetical protein PKD15_05345, partial [Candidatus Saccharibacteria bacterium]|nr:hypothetical protein [Candidatus Saccharibacteria bacterium]
MATVKDIANLIIQSYADNGKPLTSTNISKIQSFTNFSDMYTWLNSYVNSDDSVQTFESNLVNRVNNEIQGAASASSSTGQRIGGVTVTPSPEDEFKDMMDNPSGYGDIGENLDRSAGAFVSSVIHGSPEQSAIVSEDQLQVLEPESNAALVGNLIHEGIVNSPAVNSVATIIDAGIGAASTLKSVGDELSNALIDDFMTDDEARDRLADGLKSAYPDFSGDLSESGNYDWFIHLARKYRKLSLETFSDILRQDQFVQIAVAGAGNQQRSDINPTGFDAFINYALSHYNSNHQKLINRDSRIIDENGNSWVFEDYAKMLFNSGYSIQSTDGLEDIKRIFNNADIDPNAPVSTSSVPPPTPKTPHIIGDTNNNGFLSGAEALAKFDLNNDLKITRAELGGLNGLVGEVTNGNTTSVGGIQVVSQQSVDTANINNDIRN